jgi:hypothetical protein
MLPGSFTSTPLEISHLAHLAAEHLPETLHFFMGQSPAGEVVAALAGQRR